MFDCKAARNRRPSQGEPSLKEIALGGHPINGPLRRKQCQISSPRLTKSGAINSLQSNIKEPAMPEPTRPSRENTGRRKNLEPTPASVVRSDYAAPRRNS